MKITIGSIEPKKKVGLVVPKGKSKSASALFAEEEEEERNTASASEAVLAEQLRYKSHSKAQERLQAALQEDPSIFEYDEVLPALTNDRKRLQEAKKARNTNTKVLITALNL